MTSQRVAKYQRICRAVVELTTAYGRAPVVHELADYCGIPPQTMSGHLGVMEAQGFVRKQRRGNNVFVEVVNS